MDEGRIKQLLERTGAFEKGHFVFTSGFHSDTYVNKDAVYPHTKVTDELCKTIALAFDNQGVEVVAAPEKGAIVIGQGVATWLERWNVNPKSSEILSVYADKQNGGFVFRRGYERMIPGRTVLVVEDLLTTGRSAKNTVEAVRHLGGIVIGVGAMVNRGGVTAEQIGVPRLVSLLANKEVTYKPDECPLCRHGTPINTNLGHGEKFLGHT